MRRLLVANRGEIAIRIMRSAKELGFATIAVYSSADRDAAHVRYADEAYLLGEAAPALSYLNGARILDVAAQSSATAIHPGYGFLAENAAFARDAISAGLTWIGPHPDAIEAMGDKIRARQAMVAAGIAVVPGGTDPITTVEEAVEAARRYGLPLAIKASGGGGGKGLKIARTLEDIPAAIATATREAAAYFKNPTIYAERYLDNPKHVELQILADRHGTVLHVGERDCSLQRRHQKLLEETPANVSATVRARLRESGVRAAAAIGYDSVGTIETLVAGDDVFFLEMNTRIQVEHTITEMTSGIDLVREQIRVAHGEPLGYDQTAIDPRGHAIEIRVNAEDPAQDFRPAPGTLTAYSEPGGFGVRVDSAARAGTTITPDYDSMISKLVVWAPDRSQAFARMRRAIGDYRIAGVPTTLAFLRALCDEPEVVDATYGTSTLEAFAAEYRPSAPQATAFPAVAENAASEDQAVRVEVNGRLFSVRVLDAPNASRGNGARSAPRAPARRPAAEDATGSQIRTPMHGVVVEIAVAAGDEVESGQVVAIVEAMKMMNEIRAHRAGRVAAIAARPGETIDARGVLLELE